MQVIRVPSWGVNYCSAEYYGRRHSLHIGPFLIFWGQMSEDEIAAWDGREAGAMGRDKF